MAREPRRLAAIVAIDVVGYSRLMGRNESGTHALLKTHLIERVMPSLRRHEVRVVKWTGDGALAEFGSTIDALSALIELQQEMANVNHDEPEADRVVFRAGVHLGEVIVEDNDLYGDAVNVAARLEGEAPPGGILISRAVREAVSGRIKAEFQPLGELSLKNISRPIRAFRVEWKEADWPTKNDMQSESPSSAPPPAPQLDGAPQIPDKPSIAVLPFQNMSGDREQEYFADGITEDIITALSHIRWLFVIARNSSFVYKGRAVDVKRVAREFGVRYVLEGSVRKVGNRVRITAQLVDAQSGAHHWAERYDRDLADIFALQDEITRSVAAAIEPRLLAAEGIRTLSRPAVDLDAWDMVARAMSQFWRMTGPDVEAAIALLKDAVARHPDYGPAHSMLAFCLVLTGHFGWLPIYEVPSLPSTWRGARSRSTTTIPGPISRWVMSPLSRGRPTMQRHNTGGPSNSIRISLQRMATGATHWHLMARPRKRSSA